MAKNAVVLLIENTGIVFRGSSLSSEELSAASTFTGRELVKMLEETNRVIVDVCYNANLFDYSKAQLI